MARAYEFRIAGRLSAELLASFDPSASRSDDGDTVFVRAVVDDCELFGIIGRCEVYGLHLLGVQQLPRAVPAELPDVAADVTGDGVDPNGLRSTTTRRG